MADGKNGLKVLQLTSPESQPRFYGFSPDPKPELIAWYRTSDPALSLSRPLERDRAVDETGGQVAVFGRRGARPFTLPEMQSLFLNEKGEPWFVDDDVTLRVQRTSTTAASDRARGRTATIFARRAPSTQGANARSE